MSSTAPEQLGDPGRDLFVRTQSTPEFQELRGGFRKFVFPTAAFFLVWYFAYVLLAAFAKDFMATKVVGNIRLGLVLGLLQFLSTFVITVLYVRWADRVFDTRADALRERLELSGGTATQTTQGVRPSGEGGADLPEVLDGALDGHHHRADDHRADDHRADPPRSVAPASLTVEEDER